MDSKAHPRDGKASAKLQLLDFEGPGYPNSSGSSTATRLGQLRQLAQQYVKEFDRIDEFRSIRDRRQDCITLSEDHIDSSAASPLNLSSTC